MLIAIVCQNFKLSGGMERYVFDLVNAFHTLDIIPTVFSRNFDTTIKQYKWIHPCRINTNLIPSKLRDYYFNYVVSKLTKQQPFDCIISTSRISSADIAICGGTHLGFLTALNRKQRLSDRWQIQLEEKFYTNAQIVIAHSQSLHHEICNLYNISAEKAFTLYPPLDLTSFKPVASIKEKIELRKKLKLPLNKTLFLFPCGGDPVRKGLPLLEKFFSQTHKDIALIVAGRKFADKNNNIYYIGHRPDMNHIYQACDCTILASEYEPFGLIGPESIASGTEVLISDRVACSEILSPETCHVFEHGSISSLGTSVEQFLKDHQVKIIPPLEANKIENSWLIKNLSPKEHLTKMLSLFEQNRERKTRAVTH